MQAQNLVPRDGAALAESTLPHSVAVAQAPGRRLTLLPVVPTPVVVDPVLAMATLADHVAERQVAALVQTPGLGAAGIPAGSPTDPGTFAWLTADLRPAVRLLAEHVMASEPKAIILSFFRQQPRTALTCGDVAAYVDLPLTTVAAALAEWMAGGLIEELPAGDLLFYRLTRDPDRLQALAELVAWRAHWIDPLWRVAHVVDPRLHLPLAWKGRRVVLST